MAGRAPDQRLQSQQEFFELKRLGQIVVRACAKTRGLVGKTVARGQDQHGRIDVVASKFAQQRNAIEPRQSDIEDHRVIRFGFRQMKRVHAVGRDVNGKRGLAQETGDFRAEQLFVLSQQNSHTRFPARRGCLSANLPASAKFRFSRLLAGEAEPN